ncbi:Crp/Fnr family transcriptional regulator [Intestinibacter bartlettii]|uniref:Crp/Fnr family transcriptional regulator n=1 Tax=Intestinibacter bartlettii TaxID=261299 RepID=A0ABS6DYD1_9FIRM|nr:Crp/Fnr family transcriptional regulator [Intestinibacter bartlettii]MBU5336408.1 Crp/Fnr family transcriptional regulator [Intestinibacter bartlettii]MDO5010731.1 Crp/Fnr family transcriptional regulator [Intestinibacter bartlettii]
MCENKEILLNESLPFFKYLSKQEKDLIYNSSHIEEYHSGELIYSKYQSCTGLVLVANGILRSFMSSLSGKEITLFKLFEKDLCVLSSSCFYQNLSYDINLQAVENSSLVIIDGKPFKELLDTNIDVQKFMFEVTQSKLSEIMGVLEQVVFFSLEHRLSEYLIEQYYLKNSLKIDITHEAIANDLGSSREVISRMLKRFEKDNLVKLNRGCITIINIKDLQAISNKN